ncbi:MAG: hypothetical protein ACM3SP_25870 [Chloroflexota bacterium]
MDSIKYSKSDPTVLLLNEIEILFAQARLLELCLKQAEASANDEMARLHERYENELTTLRTELTAKKELSALSASQTALVAEMRERIASLENQLVNERRVIESRDTELQRTKSDAEYLRDRINQLESVHQQAQAAVGQAVLARQGLEGELDTLRRQLAKQQESFEEHRRVARQTQEGLQSHVAELQGQLQNQAQSADKALEAAANEIGELRRRAGELQASLQRTQEHAAREIEQARGRFETQLAALHSTVETQEQSLQQNRSAMIELELGLKHEIEALQSELEQKQALLEGRDRELGETGKRVGALEQELAAANRSVHAKNQELDAVRRADENRIAELEHQITVRERELGERQEAVTAVELALHARIQGLQQELARSRSEIEERTIDAKTAQIEAAASRQRIAELESAAAGAELRAQEFADAARRERESEITGLRAALALQESAAAHQERALKSAMDELNAAINHNRDELDQQRQLTEQANRDLERLRTELAAAENQKVRAEQARSRFERDWQQASHACRQLESLLQAKDEEFSARIADLQQEHESALREREGRSQALEAQLNEELARLREQVRDSQKLSAQTSAEVESLRGQIARLQAHNAQADQIRQENQALLQAKEEALRATQKNTAEQAARLEAMIHELRTQLAEKHLLVESRAAEIAELKDDLSAVTEQLAERAFAENEAKAQYKKDVESAHTARQEELGALQRESLIEQERLETELTQERQNGVELTRRIADLEEQCRSAEARLQAREQELTRAAAEVTSWQERFDQVKLLRHNDQAARNQDAQARQELDSALATLRSELQEKSWALAQQQAALENLALTHKSQIDKLEHGIDENRRVMEAREVEIENSRSRSRFLEQRVEELQAQSQIAEQTARQQTQRLTEEYSMKIDDMNKQLTQNAAQLQEREASLSDREQALRNEIDRLMREAQEKNRILQDRNDELVRVKAEMDRLHERLNQFESAVSRADATLASETERMRTDFQAQLALLQAELSQKEWAIEEQRAAALGIGQKHSQQIETLHREYREQIESLGRQLVDSESRLQKNDDHFLLGEDRLTEEQKERLSKFREVTAPISNSEDRSFPASDNRRWHSRFNWKRRWKS